MPLCALHATVEELMTCSDNATLWQPIGQNGFVTSTRKKKKTWLKTQLLLSLSNLIKIDDSTSNDLVVADSMFM